MQKDTKKLIIILSIGLICSIVFLGFCILYGLTHQATKKTDVWKKLMDDREYRSEFIIGSNYNNF